MLISDHQLRGLPFIDPAVLDETPEQRECALQATRLYDASVVSRYNECKQTRVDAAHTVLVVFKDMQTRHPTWIESMNRFLESTGIEKPNVRAWAKKAWTVYCDWCAMPKNSKIEG